MSDVEVFDSAASLAIAMSAAFERAAADAITARGVFCCALTGGSAATSLYPTLARAAVDWARVQVYFGDERVVPPGHPDSNFALARTTLLDPVKVPTANVHRVPVELGSAAAAERYASGLPVLDLVHLGMGPDGHVCSLFPGHPLLLEQARRVAWLEDSPKPPPARVTLTLPALIEARAVWFLVMGSGKAAAVREALEEPTSPLPAAQVHQCSCAPRWFLDREASAQRSEARAGRSHGERTIP